jgi:hypothetical protein
MKTNSMVLPFRSKGTFMWSGGEGRGDLRVPQIESWLTIEKFVSKNLEEEKAKQPCTSILRPRTTILQQDDDHHCAIALPLSLLLQVQIWNQQMGTSNRKCCSHPHLRKISQNVGTK